MAGRMEEPKEKLVPEKEVAKLITRISELPRVPAALSLAVESEMMFSLLLLEQCLKLAATDYLKYADHILNLLMARLQRLERTPALNPHSRSTKINRAFVLTAQCFARFTEDNFTLRQILNFDAICQENEKELLAIQKEMLMGKQRSSHEADDLEAAEEKIYQFVYELVFKEHTIRNAMSFIPKKNDILGTDNWESFLGNIIKKIPDRQTFIRIVSFQVEKQDWPHFFSHIKLSALYKLVLGISLKKHLDAHERKPILQQGVHELNDELLEAADKLLHSTFESRWTNFFAAPGEAFKARLEKEHGCENQQEVMALAYALFYSYFRVRYQLPKYSGKAAGVSDAISYVESLVTIMDKDDKLDACKIILQFILASDVFSEKALLKYVDDEATAGRLTKGAVAKFKQAISQGALMSLLSAMYVVQRNIEILKPPQLK